MAYECVPLYDTLGENAIEYIINHSEASFVVVSSAKLAAFAGALPKITQPLKGVCYWGPAPAAAAVDAVAAKGLTATAFDAFITAGALLPQAPRRRPGCRVLSPTVLPLLVCGTACL